MTKIGIDVGPVTSVAAEDAPTPPFLPFLNSGVITPARHRRRVTEQAPTNELIRGSLWNRVRDGVSV